MSTDVGYLSNVISAFGMGSARLMVVLKEVLGLSDPGRLFCKWFYVDLSQKLSAYNTVNDDASTVVQRIAKARGVLACCRSCSNKQLIYSHPQ